MKYIYIYTLKPEFLPFSSFYVSSFFPPFLPICIDHGHKYALPQLRRCDRCVAEGLRCTKFAVLGFSMDCASTQKKCMGMWMNMAARGELEWGLALVLAFPDYYHVLKTLFMGLNNWWLSFNGKIITLEMLRTLRDDHVLRPHLIKLGLSADAVIAKDRHATEVIAQRSQLHTFLQDHPVTTIVMTLVPSLKRLWIKNLKGLIKEFVDVTAFSRQHYFIIGKTLNSFQLFEVRLHAPNELTPLMALDEPRALSSCQRVLFILTKHGIEYYDKDAFVLEDSPGRLSNEELDKELTQRNLSTEDLTMYGKAYTLLLARRGEPQSDIIYHPNMLKAAGLIKQLTALGVDKKDLPKTVADKRTKLRALLNLTDEDIAQVETDLNPKLDKEVMSVKSAGNEYLFNQPRALAIIKQADSDEEKDIFILHVIDTIEIAETKQSRLTKVLVKLVNNQLIGEVALTETLPHWPGCTWTDIACSSEHILLCSCAHASDAKHIDVKAGLYELEQKEDERITLTKRSLVPQPNPLGITSNSKGEFIVTTTLPGPVAVYRLNSNWDFAHLAGGEQGLDDGYERTAKFSRPVRVTVFGDDNIFIADALGIRAVMSTTYLILFLKLVDAVVKAYRCRKRTHLRKCDPKETPAPITEVITALQSLLVYLNEQNEQAVEDLNLSSNTTNGPEGTTSDATRSAIALLVTSLTTLQQFLKLLRLQDRTDCRALGTKGNEFLHSLMRTKEDMPNLLSWLRRFISVVLERAKRLHGRYPYCTSTKKSHYEVREPSMYSNISTAVSGSVLGRFYKNENEVLDLIISYVISEYQSSLPKFPAKPKNKRKKKKQNEDNAGDDEKHLEYMRDLSAARYILQDKFRNMRMRNIRSEATKVKCGTLPLAAYQAKMERERKESMLHQVRILNNQNGSIPKPTEEMFVLIPRKYIPEYLHIPDKIYNLGRVQFNDLKELEQIEEVAAILYKENKSKLFENTGIIKVIPYADLVVVDENEITVTAAAGVVTASSSITVSDDVINTMTAEPEIEKQSEEQFELKVIIGSESEENEDSESDQGQDKQSYCLGLKIGVNGTRVSSRVRKLPERFVESDSERSKKRVKNRA